MEELRTELRDGFAYSLQPPTWVRGPAVIDGDEIVLEDRQRETYQPHAHGTEMLFELVGIDEPHDVLRFVRQYGLLQHGPEAGEHREQLSDWRIAVGWLTWTLKLCIDLAAFVDGDASRYEALRANELVRIHAKDREPPVLREDLKRLASGAVAHAVTSGLGDVRMRVVAETESVGEDGEPGFFRYFFEPSDLLGHAFAAVAHLIVQNAPLASCPQCGRFFPIEHGRQQFCTPTCASRARYERFVAKRKREEPDDE